MTHNSDGKWELEIMDNWPAYVQLNVFGYDDYFYGDTDGDGVLDRLPPNSAAPNYVNMTAPPKPYIAWTLIVDDATLTWSLEPRGSSGIGAIMYGLLLSIPIITATLAVLIFMWSFYGIKYNQFGVKPAKETSYFPIIGVLTGKKDKEKGDDHAFSEKVSIGHSKNAEIIGWPEDKNKRRKVLIATLEYEIIDWKLKVKIGGLGVMSSLMGKSMTDVDLIWVIPKVKDLEYPPGDPADPIEVIIFGEPYLIEVETHTLDNITYIILDSPVFRAQTKADPYPARMDDLSSAIFYSTWNQAIAAAVRRYPDVDVYYVNDHHDGKAPYYGCMSSITLAPMGFKALVMAEQWARHPLSLPNSTQTMTLGLKIKKVPRTEPPSLCVLSSSSQWIVTASLNRCPSICPPPVMAVPRRLCRVP